LASFEDGQDLQSRINLPQRPERKKVEHTDTGSKADVSDLLDPIRRQEFRPELQTHIIRANLNCEATHASGSGHSGPATHFVQLEGEQEHQQTPVCDAHLGKIIENSLSRGEYGVSKKRIHPEDVAKHLAFKGIQEREKRTYLESYLYSKGMRGEEALVGRTNEELGKGGGKGASALEEAKSRRSPEERASTLERALEKVRTHGGHNIPSESTPTVNVDGKDMSLADSYSRVASLRRKTEPERYNLQGVRSPEGKAETLPTPTRVYDLNKMGAPNTRGGRKKAIKTETWDTSNENLPGYTEAEMEANPELRKSHEERKAAGIPVTGIQPRGFSRNNNKRVEVTLTGLSKEAPEVSAIERYAAGRESRVTDTALEDIQSSAEAQRLRDIEGKKQKIAESRNSAFKIDWNDIPRP
jgi:hypothetical protein